MAKLEKVREEQERFEQKISLEPPSPTDESEQELDELCSIASDIPELWNHPAVTNQDKKEILRCVIDHVLVSTDKKKIDAKIVWQSGTETSFSIWQRGNWGSLIGELHAQKLTASEIQEHLAAGKTSTGQVLNITQACIYTTLRNLRLKPWRLSTSYFYWQRKLGIFTEKVDL